ncbi:MAG: translocation/assembly module TamB domain-containing protein [Deltaproteobacteria bacterium]|nr:translocation/assembly module TamB domain-containing protein [Deltaproteobacteria bacterium]
MIFISRHLRALTVVGFFILLIVAIQMLVNVPLYQKLAMKFATRSLPVQIHFDKLRFRMIRGQIFVQKASVTGPKGLTFSVDKVLLTFSPFSLLRGKIILSHLEADDLKLYLSEKSSKNNETDKIDFEAIRSKLEGLVLLRSLIIREAKLRRFIISSPGQEPLVINEVNFSFEPRLIPELGWGVTLSANQIMKKDQEIAHEAKIDFLLSRNRLNLSSLNFRRDGFLAHAEGDLHFKDLDKVKGELSISLELPTALEEPIKAKLVFSSYPVPFKIEKISATLGKASFEGEGTLNIKNGEYRIPFVARDLPLESIFGKLPPPVLHHSKGLAILVEGEARGRLPELKASAKANIVQFRHRSLAAESVSGDVAVDWPRLTYSASVGDGGPNSWKSTGDLLFKRKNPETKSLKCDIQKIELSFSEVALTEVLPESNVKGSLSGHFVLKDTADLLKGTGEAILKNGVVGLFSFDRFSSSIQLEEKRWTFSRAMMAVSEDKKWSFENPITLDTDEERLHFLGHPLPSLEAKVDYLFATNQWEIKSLLYRHPYGELKVGGTWQSLSGADLNFKGSLPVEDLTFFESVVQEGSGAVLLSLHLKGPPSHLVSQGTIDFQKAGLGLRMLKGTFSNLNGHFVLSGSEITSQDFRGNYDEGDFEAKGKIRWDGFKPNHASLNIKMRGVNFIIPDESKIEFSADLSVNGSLPNPLIQGRVDLTEGRYFRKFTVSELVIKPVLSAREETPKNYFLSTAQLDLVIKNSGDLKIDNNLITRLFLQTDLRLKGTLQDPRITGSVTVLPAFGPTDGIIHFLGSRFQVTEGRIDFSDPYKINPHFEISATQYLDDISNIERQRVSLRITGDLDNLRLVPVSSSVNQRDFTCLLLYGVSCQEARQTSKTVGGTVTSSVVSGQISSIVDDSVSSRTALDIFRLESGGPEQATVSKVTVGKSLTDRLTLEFTNDFAPEVAERTVRTNYYLTDHILLSARQTRTVVEANRYRFNLIFRFELR